MYENIMLDTAKRAEYIKKDGDYFKDGLLYCGVCNEPKQKKYVIPYKNNQVITPYVLCRCQREQEKKEKRLQQAYDRKQKTKELVRKGITTAAFKDFVFSNDDKRQPDITELCKNYVKHWDEMKKTNTGLLFYGEVGKGKSFYSGCIANALINNGVSVLFATLSGLVQNRVETMKGHAQLVNLKEFECFVLDDIGVENATQTAYNIINDIYLMKKPLIVTTNLTPNELKAADTIDKKRIFDRIIEMCVKTVWVHNDSSRLKLAKEKRVVADRILQTEKQPPRC